MQNISVFNCLSHPPGAAWPRQSSGKGPPAGSASLGYSRPHARGCITEASSACRWWKTPRCTRVWDTYVSKWLSTSPLFDSNDLVYNLLSHPVLFWLRRNVWKRKVVFTALSRVQGQHLKIHTTQTSPRYFVLKHPAHACASHVENVRFQLSVSPPPQAQRGRAKAKAAAQLRSGTRGRIVM